MYKPSAMATGEVIVKKALDQLQSTLTPEDVRLFSNTSLADLWREARKVENEQGARLDLRFMRRLEPFLRSLESYAGVIEVFCQGYAPMAFIWVRSVVESLTMRLTFLPGPD